MGSGASTDKYKQAVRNCLAHVIHHQQPLAQDFLHEQAQVEAAKRMKRLEKFISPADQLARAMLKLAQNRSVYYEA